MRRVLMGCLVVAVTALAGCGKDRDQGAAPAEPVDTSFSELKKEYDDTIKKFREENKNQAQKQKELARARVKDAEERLREAKTDDEKKAAQQNLNMARQMASMNGLPAGMGPDMTFAPRFLAFAERNPTDPSAYECLVLACRTSGGPRNRNGIFLKAIDQLRANHATRPEIKQVIRGLGQLWDAPVQGLLREVMAKHPDQPVQALACKELAASLTRAVQEGEQIKARPEMRPQLYSQQGKERIDTLLANLDKNRAEAAEVKKTLQEKYGGAVDGLPIGKPAPEVVGKDLAGKTVKLSDLKGKVVVLDIWATWCPPCRAMIPHEREMVARLKDKPFVLVSISADAKKETLTEFLAKEPMPWTHWWNGSQGGILTDWDVKGFPTIYVLDAKGVVRYKNVRGQDMEEAVNALLAEMEVQKSSS